MGYMETINKVGDLYHKHLYRHISKGTSEIADSTDYAISDLVLGGSLFSSELLVGLLGSMAYNSAVYNIQPKLSDFSGAALVFGTLGITYGMNLFRTPLEKKLGLDENINLDEDKELDKTIWNLNRLGYSPKLSFSQTNEAVNTAIDSFVERVEGYKVDHSKKTKLSIFSKHLLRRRIGGLMNPFLQEVIVTSELFPESIAHEKAHMVGYGREHEAQLVGYLSMALSDNPSLQYLAYIERLNLLTRHYSDSWEKNSKGKKHIEVLKDKFEQKGLNERTIGEVIEREIHLDEEFSKNSRYRMAVSSLEGKMRTAMLKILGQGNLKIAYVEKPLKLMSSYDKLLEKK